MQRIWQKWTVFARWLGNVNARIFLTLFYFVVVGAVSLLIGRWQNFLKRRLSFESNWGSVATPVTDLSDAKRQF